MTGVPVTRTLVDDHVLKTRQASTTEVERHGLDARRPAGDRPEAVNDYIVKQIHVLINPFDKNTSVQVCWPRAVTR